MSSRRFPGKVLAPFRGEPLVRHVVRAAGAAVGPAAVVVLTSTDPSDDPLAAYLERLEVACFRGPLDDVFERFRLCAAAFPCDWVLRICADSPLLDEALLRKVVSAARDGCDLLTTVHPRTSAHGHSAELIRVETLLAVDSRELTADDREHVTPFFYRHPERFAIRSVDGGGQGPGGLSLVVDTVEDLHRLEAL